eukprot:5728711-Pyramimonas_sp.AAC.1
MGERQLDEARQRPGRQHVPPAAEPPDVRENDGRQVAEQNACSDGHRAVRISALTPLQIIDVGKLGGGVVASLVSPLLSCTSS